MQQAERFAIVALLATPDDAGEECLKVDKQVKGNVASTAKYVEQRTCQPVMTVAVYFTSCSGDHASLCDTARWLAKSGIGAHVAGTALACSKFEQHVRNKHAIWWNNKQCSVSMVGEWNELSLEDLSFSMGASPQKIEDAFAKSGKKQKSKRR